MVKNSVTRINNLSRSVQTRPKPDNPAKPPDDNPIPARFSSFRLNSRFRRRFFFRFRSSFRQEFSSFRREFPVSGENSRFRHAFSSDFDPVIGKNFPVSSENFQFPARISRFRQRFFFRFRSSFRQEFSSFRWEFPVSGENSRSRRRFFFRFRCLFNSGNRSDQTDANHHRKPNQPFFRRSVSGYSAPPPDAGRSSPGWVDNRPGPTRGQP